MEINKFKHIFLEIIETFFSSLVVLMVIYLFVAFPEVVFGRSMEPTLHTGERILVERLSKNLGDFERGDIVVLTPPGVDNEDYVKRIIGIPGDILKILDCKVYVTRDNSRFVLTEPYLDESMCTVGNGFLRDGRSLILEENEYFVLGDNRTKSADSRVFGIINKENIRGKVVFRFWPFNKAYFF